MSESLEKTILLWFYFFKKTKTGSLSSFLRKTRYRLKVENKIHVSHPPKNEKSKGTGFSPIYKIL